MERLILLNILKLMITIHSIASAYFAIKKEKARKDIDDGITYRNGTSECKGENIMMHICLCVGIILLIWAIPVK